VVDCSDERFEERTAQTHSVLHEIGAERVPYLMVYNKIDCHPEFIPPVNHGTRGFGISAKDRIGISALKAEIIAFSDQYLRNRNSGKPN
jgi:GTPase